MGKLLTVPEMAERLAISNRGLYRLVAAGRVPYVRVGRQLRFDPERVVTALEWASKPRGSRST